MDDDETTGGAAGASQQQQLPGTAVGTGTRQPVAAQQPPPSAPPATTESKNAAGARAMSPEQLSARLVREREAAARRWTEALGVKTPEEAARLLEDAKSLKAEQDQKRLAEMSEIDRLKAENDQLRARVAELEQTHVAAIDQLNQEKQDRIVSGIAQRYFDPDYVDFAANRFATYLRSLSDEQVERMTEVKTARWFADFAKERPRLAKQDPSAAPPPSPGKPAPVVRKITTGAPPVKRPADAAPPASSATVFNGKEVRPGYPNSMTPAELSDHLAKQGIDYGRGANAGRSRIAKDAARARATMGINGKATPLR